MFVLHLQETHTLRTFFSTAFGDLSNRSPTLLKQANETITLRIIQSRLADALFLPREA